MGTGEVSQGTADGPRRESNGLRDRLRRSLRRWTAAEHELDASSLESATVHAGRDRVTACRLGARVAVTGRLSSVTSSSRGAAPVLSAELFDGTGTIDLVWLGRRRVSGIEPGRTMTVEGRVNQHDGRKVIYNPYYTLERSESLPDY